MNKKSIAMFGLLCFLGLWFLEGCSKKETPAAEQPASSATAQPAATPIDQSEHGGQRQRHRQVRERRPQSSED